MPITLSLRDESLSGAVENRIEFDLPVDRISLRELIRVRVQREWQEHAVAQRKGPTPFAGLVRPQGVGPVDWQRQVEVACEAFEQKRIIVLAGERQMTSLDELVEVGDQPVVFVRLVPLVGG